MQGKKKLNITPGWILGRISAWQIYKMYVPGMSLEKKIISPFRREKDPSFKIFEKDGEIFHKDYGASEFRGDCFDLVGQIFGLSYPQSLDKVAQDFALVAGNSESRRVEWEQPEIIKKTYKIATNRWGKWQEWHKAYLAQYHLVPGDMKFCRDTRVCPVREWAINGARVPMEEEELCFEYNLSNIRGNWKKIYRPNAPKDWKWRSNIPFNELHNVGAISGGCEVGILTKSLKEGAWITKYITPCVEILQAEDITALSVEEGRRIKESCKRLYVSLDNDEKGVKASLELTKYLECGYINPPKQLLKEGVSDWTDMSRYYDSPDPVIDFFKSKNVIR